MSGDSEGVERDALALQKWLIAMGVGSKREVRQAIRAGEVTVDGEVTTRFARPVPTGADVVFRGDLIERPAAPVWLLMNKPKKHLTQREDDEERGAQGLGRYLPDDLPWLFPVGRLDYNTEGALLWTNDGVTARKILHPSYRVPKVYRVKVRDHLTEDDPGFGRIRDGLRFRNVTYEPARIELLEYRTRATWVEIVIHEGKFREIRRMCQRNRWQIVKLRRVAVGPIQLGEINPRCVRRLTSEEISAIEEATSGAG